jgi:hypothetical protein
MPQHKKPRGHGGFKGFLRRLFSRTGTNGSAASTADPLHVDSGPHNPHRKGPSHK